MALFHKLAGLGNSGIVKGRAYFDRQEKNGDTDQVPSKHHEIVVSSVGDGQEFRAYTNKDGDFTFGALSAGKYELKPNTKPGLWTMWSGEFDVEVHGCTDFDLDFHTDGVIAGKLVFPAGVDPDKWEVQATPADNPDVFPASDWTDASGQFALHGLKPGKYIVVFEKTEMRDGQYLKVDLYAPGTPLRSNAQVVELGPAGRANDIELVIPPSALEEH